MIEVLVNLEGDPELFPDSLQLIKAEASENVSILVLNADVLPANWRNNLAVTRAIGDDWLRSGRSALLAVPSVPSPESLNYLFNPLHRDAAGVTIVWCKRLDCDRRQFRLS
jgi:RES domain-containing protein